MNVIARGHQYDVTVDGRFLSTSIQVPATPITLLLNWKPARVAESDAATFIDGSWLEACLDVDVVMP
jgi:hypothetical protein